MESASIEVYVYLLTLKEFFTSKHRYMLPSAGNNSGMCTTLQAKLLSQLRHPNIVSYRESFQDEKGFLHIVMNFCEGGDLYTKLKAQSKDGKILEETQVVEWFVQIAMALQVKSKLI